MRFVASILIVSLLLGNLPAPARALSTQAEIAQGERLNKQVDRESPLVTDPFLTDWTNRVGNRLAQYRARPDITYHVEILDSSEINSFALPGGFIHIDIGALNFVSSDDELASILAHEMGHVERRHVVTLGQKANILSILLGVLSIFSPIVYALGGIGGDLAIYKFSRQDELQADQYGLRLMSRAGYDPQASIDVMARLLAMAKEAPESRFDKAFADHPAPKDRIAHLMGYPELDRPSAEQETQRGIHDEEEGRFSYALAKLTHALKRQPDNGLATQHVAAVKIALSGSPADHFGRASGALAALGDSNTQPSINMQLATAAGVAANDFALVKDQAKSGRQEIEAFYNQVRTLASSVPNLPDPKKDGNNLSMAEQGLDRLARDLNTLFDNSSDVFGASTGLLEDNQSALRDMAGPLRSGNPTPKTRALLPYYPVLAAHLASSSDAIVRAVARARASLAMGSDNLHLLTDFLTALNRIDASKGDIPSKDMPAVQAALDPALAAWDAAAAMATEGSNFMYAAQTKNLSARVTLLDLMSSPQRFAAFRRAIAFRFPGIEAPDYASVARAGTPPGEVACYAWLAFETKERVSDLIRSGQSSTGSCDDLALGRHLLAESMEIAEGLIYQDYVDKPQS